MIKVNVQFGSSLLELALLSRHYWDQIVVEATLLEGLQHEAAFLRDEGLVGQVGDGGDIAQTAAVVRHTNRAEVEICNKTGRQTAQSSALRLCNI